MLVLLLAACTIQEDAPDGAADDVVDTTNDPGCAVFAKPHLDFGGVAIGIPSVLEINIRNDCAGQLEVSRLGVTPSSGFSASLVGPPVLAQGEKTRVSVGFAPWSGDDFVGELWIEGLSVAFTERLPLLGYGLAPRVRADRETIAFVDVTPGCSDQATLVVENVGHADMNLLGFEIEGEGFEVGGLPEETIIPVGGSLPITITWSAASYDVPNGRLLLLTDDPAQPELRIALSGAVKPGARRSELFESSPRPIDLVIGAQGDGIETALDAAIVAMTSEFDAFDVTWRGYVVTVDTNGATYAKKGWRTRATDLTTDTKALAPTTTQDARLLMTLPGFVTAEKPGANDAIVAAVFAVDREQWVYSYLDMFENTLDEVAYGAIAPDSACGTFEEAAELRKAVKNKGGALVDACDTDWAPDVREITNRFVADAVGFKLADEALDGITATVDGDKADSRLLSDGRTAIVEGAYPGSDVIISYVPVPDTCP